MIPHCLQIKNFLSYGPDTQTINFSNYHLICLSGKNGHGKSALLDAITWALWGQARKNGTSSKPDAGLLHLGQKHMMVILEFEVNKHHYRIRREYIQTASKPYASLDFGIKNETGSYTALTDKTIKDTQEKIEKTIGITYESFTNSTFLKQGQSNEFSKKSPKERKEILAEILQLEQFENKKKIAQTHLRALQQKSVLQCNIKDRIDQELLHLTHVQVQYQNLIATMKSVENQTITLQQHRQHELEKQKATEEALQQQKLILQQQKKLQSDIENISNRLQALGEQIKTTESIDIAALKAKESEYLQTMVKLQNNQQQKMMLQQQYLNIKEQITTKTASWQQDYMCKQHALEIDLTQLTEKQLILKKELESLSKTVQELEKSVKTVQESVQTMQSDIIKTETITQQQAQTEKNIMSLQKTLESLLTEKSLLETQLHTTMHNQKELNEQDHAACLLCLQPINHEQKTSIAVKMTLNIEAFEKKRDIVLIDIAHYQEKLDNQKNKIESIYQAQTMITSLRMQQTEQNKQLLFYQNQLETYVQQLSTIRNQYQIICNAINAKQTQKNELEHSKEQTKPEIIKQLEQELSTITYQGKNLNFQESTLNAVKKDLQEIQQKIEHVTKTSQAINKEMLLKEYEQLMKEKDLLTQQQSIAEQSLVQYQGAHKEFEAITCVIKKLTLEIELLHQQYQDHLIEKGSLALKQKNHADFTIEQEKTAQTIKYLNQEIADYQEIVKALGKDGIQALLIEQAIPEIEHETNLILSRLTNNQTQIFIESLRDLKKGGSKETLDIKISDPFGLRDYEMFSGGEAFRIDFALRIGICKLLARRAGTTLQTIFIDEGFGSQDEEGLQLIMDNIYKIQDEFSKIIIVSHLPEMKDQFPVHFLIEKKRSGSTVSVIEQG